MKKLAVSLAVAVVATGVITTKLWLDLRAENRKAGDLAARTTEIESRPVAQAIATPMPEPVSGAGTAGTPQAAAPPIANAPAIPQPAAPGASSPAKAVLDAMATPEGQDSLRNMMRVMMAQMYPDIEKELGITAQEKQQLINVLADVGEDPSSLLLAGAKDPAARREMQRKMVEDERAREARLKALLGNKYPKWEEYQSVAAARQQVEQLRMTLGATGNPLSESQTQQLVTAFAAEQKRSDKENRDWTRSSAASDSPDMMMETVQRAVDTQGRLLSVAGPILNASQLDRYKQQVEQQTTVLRATMSFMGGGAP